MATNTNTDLTEEDAADLQFPKAAQETTSPSCSNVEFTCTNCHHSLAFPFISCSECKVLICCGCFAKGVEFPPGHRNDHPYSVIKDDFVLFPGCDWTAREELKLIEEFDSRRNLDAVAKIFPNRTVKEVKEHYERYYVDGEGSPLIPIFGKRDTSEVVQMQPPYNFRLTDLQDPPRYAPKTIGYNSVAGYNAARADFEVEYDANAEDLIAQLETLNREDPHFDVLKDLQCAIVGIYRRRLEQRRHRKRIIRRHGLILLRKTTAWLHRYDMTISQQVYEKLMRFMQFYTGQGFEFMMEGLHRAGELKIQIARLCEYRKRGITTLEGAKLYSALKRRREECLKELKVFHNNPLLRPKIKSFPALLPTKRKGSFTPLDVIGMPGYEQLQPKERELCKNVRLVPLSYIELKETLISENNKLGHLKLLTARKLLKIDVNKTRKLYDFLVEEGFIQKPPN